MDGPQLFQFVDVQLHGTWTEGLVVGLEDAGLRVQVGNTLVLTSTVHPFRSRTPGSSPVTTLRLYALDLETELEEWMLGRKYWQSDVLFVQFFAGVLPYLYSAEVVRKEESTSSRAARAVLDYYKVAQQRAFQPTESPGSATWERQVPVLCALLRDNDLLLTRKKELFFAYVSTLASLGFPLPWICTTKPFILALAHAYLRYCLQVSNIEEVLHTLLLLLRSKCWPSPKQAKHLAELIRSTVEDLVAVTDQSSHALKLEVVLEFCKSKVNLSAQDLHRSHLLSSEVAEELLRSHKKVGRALAARGFSLDFLEHCYPHTSWLALCEQRLPADPTCVRLLTSPVELSRLSNPVQAFSCLPHAEQLHFGGMFRLDQRPTVISEEQLRPYFAHRRRLLWWVRNHARFNLPQALWRVVVEQFLYPN